MGKPITTTSGGICFAFPNVCNTLVPPPPGNQVPIPYPSIGQLSDATGTATDVKAGGSLVVINSSTIPSTTGDAPAVPGTKGGKVEFAAASSTVFANGSGVVRMFDQTKQNNGNAVGQVLGGFPQVLVGD